MLPKETDWSALWRELASRPHVKPGAPGKKGSFERKERAQQFEARTKKRNEERKDPLLEYVLNDLKPGETVLDIGAGTGRWTVPLAKQARQVTAVEPSAAMLDILKENAKEAGLTNVEIIQSTWETARVSPHDIAVCAHAMYQTPDLVAFSRQMEANATRRCYLAIRLIPVDGVMGELSRKIYGNLNDSPNFIVGYNALYLAGIYTNVRLEEGSFHWTSADKESAVDMARRHLYLGDSDDYNGLIRETLEKRLVLKDGAYLWPDGMRSALIWWDIRLEEKKFSA
jgi:SAM-dependent methyltransferase